MDKFNDLKPGIKLFTSEDNTRRLILECVKLSGDFAAFSWHTHYNQKDFVLDRESFNNSRWEVENKI